MHCLNLWGATSKKYHTKTFCILIQLPTITCECKMQIEVHDGYVKYLKTFYSFSLNNTSKISLKWKQLLQCIWNVKEEIGDKEIPFGLHKKMTGEGMSAALHYYFSNS